MEDGVEIDMKEEQPILVAIWCLVYNHEPYLRDCFEGFVMQKTNFRFVAIVHDDVSTDRSADIIREYAEKYPDIIKPIYETENQWSKHDGSLDRIMNNAIAATGAKYIAWCEGDDYWTDSYKLQKQVDFLDSHPNVGLCYTDFNIYDEKSNSLNEAIFGRGGHRSVNFEDHLLSRGYIAPMTWLVRCDMYKNEIAKIGQCSDGSFALALEFFHLSQVAYISEVTATYRVHDNSASRQLDPEKNWQYMKGVMTTQLEYAKKYGDDRLVDRVYMTNYMYDLLPSAIAINKMDFILNAENFLSEKGIDFNKHLTLLKEEQEYKMRYEKIQVSKAYRLGKFLLKPFKWMRRK